MKTSVIVTTYNRPDALAIVLESFAGQTDNNFELIIADDGSTNVTAEVIRYFQSRGGLDIKHVWHCDKGFRAARIRNRAIETSSGDYLIFTDGDCVPANYFVEAHKELAEPNYFLCGNRILLGEDFTKEVIGWQAPLHDWFWDRWLKARLKRQTNSFFPLLRFPDSFLRKIQPFAWKNVRTCNFSSWRADLIKVNGLDESFEGWGYEDSDLVIRLLNSGVLNKSCRFAAPVFHLWHENNDRSKSDGNRKRLYNVLKSKAIAPGIGIKNSFSKDVSENGI